MSKLFTVAAILPLLFVTTLETPESLDSVSARIGKSFLKGDWAAFCKDAAPSISIEEHLTAYDQYFSKEGKGWKPLLGFAESKTVSFSTVIPNQGTVSKEQKLAFDKFCKLMKDARSYHSDGWGPWPQADETFAKKGFDSLSISGPCISGTVASNLDVAVEMVQIKGQWKAHRLLVLGH